jgi:hypothetical protein
MAFLIKSVAPSGLATLRVSFSLPPLAVDDNGDHDALNTANYELVGPDANFPINVVPVDEDPESLDLFLAAPLKKGDWTLNVHNVKDATETATIDDAIPFPFIVIKVTSQMALSGGATNDAIENVLRKFFNPALKGPNWAAILAGLAAGDRTNWENAKKAFDQLFLSTASGLYLDRRASDVGQRRPANVGMSDELFRRLAVTVKTKKLTEEAILEVLEVFYGSDAVRAFSTAEPAEPYALNDEDELVIVIDERERIVVRFDKKHFVRIYEATALEIAAAITRTLKEAGSQAYATAYSDPVTQQTYVRLYSGSVGLTSSVRIVGGRAQCALRFPLSIFHLGGFSPAVWSWENASDTPGRVRIVPDSQFDLDQVREGDLVYIFANDPSFDAANLRGTYEIKAVNTFYLPAFPLVGRAQTFDIEAEDVSDGSGTQTDVTEVMFFRPTKRTIYNEARRAIVARSGVDVDIVIPATTEAVSREPGTGAYPTGAPILEVSSLVRIDGHTVQVETADPHGLAVGDQIIVDGVFPTGVSPLTTPGVPSTNFSGNIATGTTSLSLGTTASQAGTFEGYLHRAVRLREGLALIVGGETVASSVDTAIVHPVALEVTNDTVGAGGRQVTYKWTNLTGLTYTIGRRLFGASAIGDVAPFVPGSLFPADKVLVTGGTNDGTTPSNAWDLFAYAKSPALTSQVSGTMPVARAQHGQASLGVEELVCGGWTTPATPIASTYTFDSSTHAWTARGAMKTPRYAHVAVSCFFPVGTGYSHVLAIGGRTGSSNATILSQCEMYDENLAVWRNVGRMSHARVDHAAVYLPDGRILVVGGFGFNPSQPTSPTTLNSCEIFDPTTNLWSSAPPMKQPRREPVVAYVASQNAIYVTAGGSPSIEILDLDTMKWRLSSATLPTMTHHSVGVRIGSDILCVVGGENNAETDTVKTNIFIVPGSDTVWAGGLNRMASVTDVVSSTEFEYDTSDAGTTASYTSAGAGATVMAWKAPDAPAGLPGPFTLDPERGLAITGTERPLGQAINAGQSYPSIALDTGIDPSPALQYPDAPGYIAFSFGFDNQVGPVRYLGRRSSSELILDASFKFPKSLAQGTEVVLLSSRTPFVLPVGATPGMFYLTSSAAGRVAAQGVIDQVVAAGMEIDVKVVYPSDIGLGGEGAPTTGASKLTDAVAVWGGDALDEEIPKAKGGAIL